ncbi:hypothetical protein D1BOALGB6SA_10291 [Olavius sp. associated proteobacterium Delta 1]|nr:hypothetical protein D1BOALGB6SA_10291 [Olavius sp. associated proteobacterium Delta 1]
MGTDILAIKLPDGRIIGNASRLPRCGSFRRGAEAPAQQVMMQLAMPMIPFNVFEEADLDLFKAEIVDQGPEEKLLLPKLVWNKRRGDLRPVRLWVNIRQKSKPKSLKRIKNLHLSKWTSYSSESKKEVRKQEWIFDKFISKNLEKRHFIGAMLLKVQNKYFLFDVDRKELKHYRFNAFLSELPKPCKTIKEAYDMLIPDEVRKATKNGLKVDRQGEWFFIPTKLPKKVKADPKSKTLAENPPKNSKYDLHNWTSAGRRLGKKGIDTDLENMHPKYKTGYRKRVAAYHRAVTMYEKALQIVHRENPNKYARRGELRAGDNRPNSVSKYVSLPEGVFVKGEVTHSGREHEPITLKTWCRPVPNTAVNSFTIQGQID